MNVGAASSAGHTFAVTRTMSYNLDDTIAAIASAAGGADRGIVRVSGPGATDIAVTIDGVPPRLPCSVPPPVDLDEPAATADL